MEDISKAKNSNGSKLFTSSSSKNQDPKPMQHTKFKPNFSHKPNFVSGNNSKDSIEPMETDSSLQSRLTYNKKLINNNEVASEYELSASEDSSDDDEEKEVNFCQANRVTRIK